MFGGWGYQNPLINLRFKITGCRSLELEMWERKGNGVEGFRALWAEGVGVASRGWGMGRGFAIQSCSDSRPSFGT